ncbi:intraflagellar transport protein 122 homolog [Lepeophtheirus salmonis]|uniref:intraflagellar transport protein 122 homolog n=1 Tax=Lepeophtheirus salmonis TaxID=72036 RepID=UPI001AE4D2A5|nr:intraflagellar transport protein 122 homolog [Lepeophtheirus salmonis]
MRAIPSWVDKVHDRDKNEQCIYDLTFRPDGSQLIVAAGQRVLVYDVSDGTLIQPLKGHKDTVYCVDYAKDGKRFASGSGDKSVIIWTDKLEGILKYSHNDAIQSLSYNPVTHSLASCAISDFGLWSSEQKCVQKTKVSSRINRCAWSPDGRFLALGLNSGTVSIRFKNGDEKIKIERGGAIWGLAWNPKPFFSESGEEDFVICVADWSQVLGLYSANSGKLLNKERSLGFDPCNVEYFSKGEFLMIGGSNKSCLLYTKEGIKLGTIGEQNSWVWTVASRPDSNFVALGCQDGTIAYYQLIFSTVHGLYRERYAFRENMTDVIIQHLLTDQKVRIKCRDLVKKIAIYKNRLAVQLAEKIVIYELYSTGEKNISSSSNPTRQHPDNMLYRVKDKINQKLDCNLLVVTTNNLILCQEKRLQSLNFKGVKEREWLMESLIRYIKVVGGPPGKEGLLVGLKNGSVLKIFLYNQFPVHLLSINCAVRCLDLSTSKRRLAIVDENSTCRVFDLETGEALYQEPNANSVAWNSQFEEMLCYSGSNSVLSIKTSDFPAHKQKMNGFVVGFSGSKIFCLHVYSMSTIEVPLSSAMFQYLNRKDFVCAYQTSCLGVTESDWETLGREALHNLDFDIAKKAFTRLKNLKMLELIADLESSEREDPVKLGDIFAHEGKFSEAAKLFKKAGKQEKALSMYSDLRMFDLANEYLDHGEDTSGARKALIKKKADWAAKINEPRAAAEMYLSAGETIKAIHLMGENGWVDMLAELGRNLDKAERESITLIANYLKDNGQLHFARDNYKKVGDISSVINLYVSTKDWKEVIPMAEKYPEFKENIFVPYAEWLAESDKFVEAQRSFHKAGRPDEAFRVLNQLTLNAVNESRFEDASYYHWILSLQFVDLANEETDPRRVDEYLKNFREYQRKASIYYAYHTIQRYTDEPFTSYMPEALFNISRYLMHEFIGDTPEGVSKFAVYYALAKQSKNLGAYKLAKLVLEKLQNLLIPKKFRENVDLSILSIKAKDYYDNQELLTMCYRCSATNPLYNKNGGNRCNNCSQPFVYSFITFEILPLIEFVLEEDISDKEALQLIEGSATKKKKKENKRETEAFYYDKDQDMEGVIINHNEGADDASEDPFTSKYYLLNNPERSFFSPIFVNRSMLSAMEPGEVIVYKWSPPLRFQFFRNVMPDMSITKCESCNRVFHTDDFELQSLQKGHCPFCRSEDYFHTPKFEGEEQNPFLFEDDNI